MSTFQSLTETQQQAVSWFVELKLVEAMATGSQLAMTDPDKFRENARDAEAKQLLTGKSDIANIFNNPPARQALENMYGASKQRLVQSFAKAQEQPEKPKKRWFI